MILKSPMNAMHNVTNPYQGKDKRVLCLCSAGILKSARLAQILQQDYNYNTRSAGVADYALILVNTALLMWADEIVCVEQEVYNQLMYDIKNTFANEPTQHIAIQTKTIILDIPDIYNRTDFELGELLKEQYEQKRLT
jgi:predicted protein tyrosine phosphatase